LEERTLLGDEGEREKVGGGGGEGGGKERLRKNHEVEDNMVLANERNYVLRLLPYLLYTKGSIDPGVAPPLL
jgi:hypothetical protein